ncbi:SDR family oxidoreductase [Sphingomonas sp. MS122]|uniref:SDR family oxidoreductase n=1 Tax=Sphingomonas sp. MS122 TaxID=3412683 RepID=UPI003C2F1E50
MTSGANIGQREAIGAITAAGLMAAPTARAQGGEARSDRPLAGKAALVTGAPRNLGRGYAVALAEDGADLMIHYHNAGDRADAQEAARLVRAAGTRAEIIEGELRDSAMPARLVAATREAFGRLDILVNNAGRMVKKPIADIAGAEYDDVFEVNARVPFFLMQVAAPHLGEGGRIINICSSLIMGFLPNYALYQGSKAALEQFTRSMAREIGPRGVTVNALAPGPIDTPFYRAPEDAAAIAYATRLAVAGRLGAVADVVPMVRFLASPAAQWVNGQTIFVNGGYVAP